MGKRQKNQNQKNEKKIIQSYVGYLLLKQVLGDVDYQIGENGKPYLNNSSYHFNISHSNNLVCLVVSEEPIGVDIELQY